MVKTIKSDVCLIMIKAAILYKSNMLAREI